MPRFIFTHRTAVRGRLLWVYVDFDNVLMMMWKIKCLDKYDIPLPFIRRGKEEEALIFFILEYKIYFNNSDTNQYQNVERRKKPFQCQLW